MPSIRQGRIAQVFTSTHPENCTGAAAGHKSSSKAEQWQEAKSATCGRSHVMPHAMLDMGNGLGTSSQG